MKIPLVEADRISCVDSTCAGCRPYVLPDGYSVDIAAKGGVHRPRALLSVKLVEAENVPQTIWLSKTDCFARCEPAPSDVCCKVLSIVVTVD